MGLKIAGIKSIGAFLLNSREILILFDATYLQRIWCVFELAVFFTLHSEGKNPGNAIRVVPIHMYSDAVLWWNNGLICCLLVLACLFSGVPETINDYVDAMFGLRFFAIPVTLT